MKKRAPKNRTLTCTAEEQESLAAEFPPINKQVSKDMLLDRIVNQDVTRVLPFLPEEFVDLLILDPPCNLTKNYNGHIFQSRRVEEYAIWFTDILKGLLPKTSGSARLALIAAST